MCTCKVVLQDLASFQWQLRSLLSQQAGLQAVQGVPKIEEGVNPATWMLEVTTVGAENKLGVNFAEIYDGSNFAKCAPCEAGAVLLTVQSCSKEASGGARACTLEHAVSLQRKQTQGSCPACRDYQKVIDEFSAPKEGSEPLHFKTKFAVTTFGQYYWLTWRCAALC